MTLLGTGAPLAPERATTGMIITASGCAPLLIDTCGGFELPRQLARAGFALRDLGNVIVTHRHMDHAGGFPALVLADLPLTIYATDDTHDGLRALVTACFPEWPLNPHLTHIAIAPSERREIGGFAVEFFAMQHRVPTVAVRVTQGGKTFAFSADSVPCDALIACARDADLFLCDALCAARDGEGRAARTRELMHPTAREAAKMAVAAGARSLALTHLARYANPDNMLAEAREIFPGPLTIPNDGTRLEVTSNEQ